nr:hypothetical protein [Tanacetum cinerariifolium]
ADDSGAVAVLDLDSGACGGMDRTAPVERSDQRCFDGVGHHR